MIRFGDTRLPGRFWSKVVDHHSGCWLWTANRYPGGYGQVKWKGRPRQAHRVAYESLEGSIGRGLCIDHLCRVRECVNPAHVEPVTLGENVLRGNGVSAKNARKTHCKNGHPLTGDNLHVVKCRSGNIGRECKTCRRATTRRHQVANREKINARAREIWAANPEKARARKTSYRTANREKVRANARAYRKANRDKINARQQARRRGRP